MKNLKKISRYRIERFHSVESFDIFNLFFEKFDRVLEKREREKEKKKDCFRVRKVAVRNKKKKKKRGKKGVQRRYSAKFQPSWTWKALCPGFETNHSGWPLHKEIYITLWKQKALRAKSFSMRDQVIFIGSAEHFVWTTKWYLMPASPAYHAF